MPEYVELSIGVAVNRDLATVVQLGCAECPNRTRVTTPSLGGMAAVQVLERRNSGTPYEVVEQTDIYLNGESAAHLEEAVRQSKPFCGEPCPYYLEIANDADAVRGLLEATDHPNVRLISAED